MSKIFGDDLFIVLRKLGEKVDANKVLFGKEYELSIEADKDTEDTFDGSFDSKGTVKTSLTSTAKMSREDPLILEVEKSIVESYDFEAWIIDSKQKGKNGDVGKYFARYLQGSFKKFSFKGEVGGVAEYDFEFNESGGGLKYGFATLPKNIEDSLKAVGYKFHDTTKEDYVKESEIPQPTTQAEGLQASTTSQPSSTGQA